MRPARVGLVVSSFLVAGACAGACSGGSGGSSGGDAPLPDRLVSPDAGDCGVDLTANVDNCGACGVTCGVRANAFPMCDRGLCTVACNAGFGNCDADDTNGCETSLGADPKNCGRCGRDCQGAVCKGGQCASVTLASGQLHPRGIAVNDTAIAWLDEGVPGIPIPGSLLTCPLAGCATTPKVLDPSLSQPGGILLDATTVYHVANNRARRCALTGCANNPLPVTTNAAFAANGALLALDGAILYGTTNARVVYRVGVDGSNQLQLFLGPAGTDAYGVAVDATSVYFTVKATGKVQSCPKDGCTGAGSTVLATGQQGPGMLVIAGDQLVWINEVAGTVVACAKTGCGAAPTVLALAQNSPQSIAAYGADVYWTNTGAGTVATCNANGCGGVPTVLADGQVAPQGIAVDVRNVYFTTDDGAVKRVAR